MTRRATPNVTENDTPTISPAPSQPENPGLEVEPKLSLEQMAAQRAAMQEFMRQRRPGAYAPLPNGQMVEVRGSVIHKYPGAKKTILLADPARIIAPEHRRAPWGPDMPRYQWRCRTDVSAARRDLETHMLHRQGKIRYVEIEEIDRESDFAIIEEYQSPGQNVYVIVDSLILCEILDPTHSYDKYTYWTDLALDNVSSLPKTVLGFPETHLGEIAGVAVTRKDAKQGG